MSCPIRVSSKSKLTWYPRSYWVGWYLLLHAAPTTRSSTSKRSVGTCAFFSFSIVSCGWYGMIYACFLHSMLPYNSSKKPTWSRWTFRRWHQYRYCTSACVAVTTQLNSTHLDSTQLDSPGSTTMPTKDFFPELKKSNLPTTKQHLPHASSSVRHDDAYCIIDVTVSVFVREQERSQQYSTELSKPN